MLQWYIRTSIIKFQSSIYSTINIFHHNISSSISIFTNISIISNIHQYFNHFNHFNSLFHPTLGVDFSIEMIVGHRIHGSQKLPDVEDRHPKRGLRGHADQTAFTTQLQSLLVRISIFLGSFFLLQTWIFVAAIKIINLSCSFQKSHSTRYISKC